MISKISETGYWSADYAHVHHVHSQPLAEFIAQLLQDQKNTRVTDLGCGQGFYLKHLQDQGFTDLIGYEGEVPLKKLFDNIQPRDLTKSIYGLDGNVVCLEVGEHIPEEYCTKLLDNFQNLCTGYLILSWAIRDQAGFGHVNCLDNEEVIEMIEKRGFKYLPELSQDARKVIDDTTPWFKNTILIFKYE